jgi:ribosomal protein S18 acetylase RimI-like enzyme
MNTAISLNDITIRTELKPGDLGYVIYSHGKLYSEEYGYGVEFEMYVAEGITEFYKNYDPAKDCVWVCEHNSTMVGFLLLVHRENNKAQLRYFFLEKQYRGIGLGNKLMLLYIDFLKQKKYRNAYLWTTNEQTAAAALYSKFGFQLTEEKDSTAFGKPLSEQRYELLIDRLNKIHQW